ncbi:hypothetical protein [Flavobacterium sp.]|uniref:hypothetical protein n=1 Tax=Flavobacterium sp. TaxID=239 RepID=UPI00286A7ED3|nr:hypothetical protein [Flavobacterium sp.]
MKNLILTMILVSSANFIQAQSTNKQVESTTTIKTVKDSDGEHKTVKKEETKAVQNIEMKAESPNTLNIEMKETPVQSVTTTKITNPDGSTRTVDTDRSSYYEYDGKKYQVALDASGYTMVDPSTKKTALLRKTSTNSYIYRNKNKMAIGYFDTNGNLILETYDDKSDKVSTETYTVVKN